MNILISANREFLSYTIVMLFSLLKNNQNIEIDIYFVNLELSKQEKNDYR